MFGNNKDKKFYDQLQDLRMNNVLSKKKIKENKQKSLQYMNKLKKSFIA